MNRLYKTESAVFQYCRFSPFLKDPFFQIIYMFVGTQKNRLNETVLLITQNKLKTDG